MSAGKYAILLAVVSHLAVGGGSAATAQTACPVGTPAGSATCGPSGGGGEMAAPPPRPAGEWIKTWGAVATSSSGGGGASSRQLSKEDAEHLALNNCVVSGAKNCRVEFTYYNQCVALAYPIGRNGGKIGTAATVERAKVRALQGCRDERGGECRVALAECSEPVFRRY